MKLPISKKALALALVLLLALGAYFAWRQTKASAAPPMRTAEVAVADLEDTVLASGTVRPLKLVQVGAQVTGQVTALHVQLGDHVKTGQLLAEIDAVQQRAQLQDEQASQDALRAQRSARLATLAQAELALARQRAMMADDATAKADLQNAEVALATAKSDVAMVETQLRQSDIKIGTAKANLGFTRITAPIDGVVVAVATEAGQTLNAVQAAPTIAKIAQLDPVQVEAQISEADVSRLRVGQAAWFTLLGDSQTRHATAVSGIDMVPQDFGRDSMAGATGGAAAGTAIYYNALLRTPNPDQQLRIGMTAQVRIVVNAAKQALAIPASALGPAGPDGRYTVQVLPPANAPGADSAQPQERKIRVGLNNRIQVQVLEGLKAGERVVLPSAPVNIGPGPGDEGGGNPLAG